MNDTTSTPPLDDIRNWWTGRPLWSPPRMPDEFVQVLWDEIDRLTAPRTITAERDRELDKYLESMDRAGEASGPGETIYTQDLRDGFRHALAMVAAFESDEPPSPDRARPPVREAARLVLVRRGDLAPGSDQ